MLNEATLVDISAELRGGVHQIAQLTSKESRFTQNGNATGGKPSTASGIRDLFIAAHPLCAVAQSPAIFPSEL